MIYWFIQIISLPAYRLLVRFALVSPKYGCDSNKAVGTADKRIKFIGAKEAKGAWRGIQIDSNTDNQLVYCDFLNMGSSSSGITGALYLYNAKVGISHCKFTNGLGTAIRAHSNAASFSEFSDFNNNVIEGYDDLPPMIVTTNRPLAFLEKLDMTSDFTRNAKQYIQVTPDHLSRAVTINQTTVPYYFDSYIRNIDYTLTINEGVTIYVAAGQYFNNRGGANPGRLIINGTANKKVKITRLPGTTGHWHRVDFYGLKESVINHCIFEYGGGGTGIGIGTLLFNSTTELTLNNVEINHSDTYGVYISQSGYRLSHSNVTFSNNRQGNVYDNRTNPATIRTNFP